MPLDFPTSPVLNQLYTFGGKTWKWDGAGWISYNVGLVGPTGAIGPIGPTGPTGTSVIIGNYVSNINGASGGITLIGGDGINISTGSSNITITNTLFTLIDGGLY